MALSQYLILALLAAAPISEARGAILYGLSVSLNPIAVFILAILINILPIPFIFWALDTAHFSRLAIFLFGKRATRKINNHSAKLEKYGELALLTFVAVPLPMTGAWMGTLVASILNFKRRKSIAVISLGILISSIIVMLGFYGFGTLL